MLLMKIGLNDILNPLGYNEFMADVKRLTLSTPLSFFMTDQKRREEKEVFLDAGEYLFLQQNEQSLYTKEKVYEEFNSYALWNHLVWKEPIYLRTLKEENQTVYQWLACCNEQENLFKQTV